MLTPASADERRVDFTVALLDIDEKPVRECADDPPIRDGRECQSYRNLTLGMVVFRALATPEAGLEPDAAIRRGQLGMGLYKSTEYVLTPEDIVLIKKQVAKIYGPMILLRVARMIDATVK
ncbi:hypothetical protein [Bradyrhizobium sp.]|uniref:hypothetical protein n=1 Tax=Bradyrhizobium sp. TaxID=376 RepID=UPI003C77940B